MQRTVIGLDVGRSGVKVCVVSESGRKTLDFPSVVSPAMELADESTRKKVEIDTVELDGKKYFTGKSAELQGGAGSSVGLNHDWIESAEYKVLVLSAIKRLKAEGVPGLEFPVIVIGLPASKMADASQAKEATLSVISAEILVIPQPMGAYCSQFITPQGYPTQSMLPDPITGQFKSYAIIDVGQYTTDFMLMKDNQIIERCMGSCDGVYKAAERLLSLLASKKGIQANQLIANESLRTKTIKHFGQQDISDLVTEASAGIEDTIIRKADSLLSVEVSTLDGVLLAGGGASLVSKALAQKWPHTILVYDPRNAIADGYCKYGLAKARK